MPPGPSAVGAALPCPGPLPRHSTRVLRPLSTLQTPPCLPTCLACPALPFPSHRNSNLAMFTSPDSRAGKIWPMFSNPKIVCASLGGCVYASLGGCVCASLGGCVYASLGGCVCASLGGCVCASLGGCVCASLGGCVLRGLCVC